LGDLYGFNLAMVAKQAWMMVIAPDSLCAQVLKAKYYPQTLILKAQPSGCMPYTFRSILKGVELLKDGLIWRIGDGSFVNIWTDNWLSRDDALQPITLRNQSLLVKVSELKKPDHWSVGRPTS
jgi:hypothetical protein